MKRIAIVTGASGGLGREFVMQLRREKLNEIWVIARTEKKLMALRSQFGKSIVPIVMDLSIPEQLHSIQKRLQSEKPVVRYLVNNAGVGKAESCRDFETSQMENIIQVNCSAMAVLTHMCLPYMKPDSHIINIASQAAFQPLPYMTMYSATKAFAKNFTRALNVELKPARITATAVCPGWIETNMLPHFSQGKSKKFPGSIKPEPVVRQALHDAKRGKDMSICTNYVKAQYLLSKLLPERLIMRVWLFLSRGYR